MSGISLGTRTKDLLHRVGLYEVRKQRLGSYSKGMLQRVGLAQALIEEPKLVVLDEPTSALDTAAQAMLAALMAEHLAGGGLIVAATHGPIGIEGTRELKLGSAP